MTEQQAPRVRAGGLFVISVLFLSVLVPVLLWPRSLPAGLATVVIVLSGARFSWLIARGEPRLMEFSTWTFVYVFFGLAPVVQIQASHWPETAPYVYLEYLESASWLILAAVLAVLVGTVLGGRRPSRTDVFRPAASVREQRVTMLAVAALALNAYYLYVVGLGAPLQSRVELRNAQVDAWRSDTLTVGIVGLCTMPLLVAFVALIQSNRQRKARGRLRSSALTFVTGAAVLYSVNPISSPRYYFGTVFMAFAATLGAYATASRVRVSAAAFLAGLLLLFPLADAFRANTSEVNVTFDPIAALTSGDFDGLVQTMNTIRYVDLADPPWGKQAIGVALFWVPREMWPDKPADSASTVAQFAGYEFTNMSSPIWAELFMSGGWPLAVVGMFGFGWFVRRWDDRATMRWKLHLATSPLALILPFYLVILLRGALLQAMVYAAIIAISAWFVRSPDQASDPARPLGVHGSKRRAWWRFPKAEASSTSHVLDIELRARAAAVGHPPPSGG